ncbi:MAG: HAD-IIB family hydrolase [Nitrospirae bacterium]|nr:HAD-IIB family hydrolase [Nitrospirota bacterium]
MARLIIFTDLDGTLIREEDYSFTDALPALEEIGRQKIPLVISSSKTRSEIEVYRERLNNRDPFIAENGGGIFIPEGYFTQEILGEYNPVKIEGYQAIMLGVSYKELRAVIEELRAKAYRIKGFGDLSVDEIAEITGLNSYEARLAKKREFDEVFILEEDDMQRKEEIFRFIKEKGYEYTKGRFYHIMGRTDKGKAVRLLIDLYKQTFGDIITVAIGDSMNDLPMLLEVQYPFIVRKSDGSYDKVFEEYPYIRRADGIGPEGWNRAVLDLIRSKISTS